MGDWIVSRQAGSTLLPVVAAPDPPAGAAPSADWRRVTLSWLSRWSRWSLWLSVGLSLLIGIVYAIHLGTALRFADEHSYVSIANNLAHHGRFSVNGVTPTAYRAPGWPLVLVPIRLLGGGIVAFRLANVVFAAVAVALGWWIARALGGEAVAALAAPALALYPIGIYTAGTLYPETLGSVLLLAGLALSIQARRCAPRLWWAAGAGASFGALILVIPNAWLPLLAVLLWLVLGPQRLWRAALCVLIVAVAVVSIWVVRNAVTMHEFIPVTDANGFNLLLANSEHASVRSGVDTNINSYVAAANVRGIHSEAALGNFYQHQALDWIRNHPARAVELYGERVVDYFAPYDSLATASQQSTSEDAVAVLTYLPLLLLLLIRLVRWRTDAPGSVERLFIWIYLANALAAAVFVTRVRYRVPFDQLLIIVAAATLVSLLAGRPQRGAGTPIDASGDVLAPDAAPPAD